MINNPNAKISLDLSNTTGLTKIEYNTFSACNNITSIIIPDCITSIDNYAFSNCSGLTSVTIGSDMISIGDYAFNECNKLTNINYAGTEEQWKQINIGDSNEYLTNATINYEYTDK
jgi:hypothetical protein